MNCREFELAIVADEPAERRRARRHAAACAACAERLAGHLALADRVALWRSSAPAPPARLEERLRRAVADDPVSPAAGKAAEILSFPDTTDRAGAAGRWAARLLLAAASLTIAALLTWDLSGATAPTSAERLMVSDALEEALAAERAHARAIARLERRAGPILAQAADAGTSARYAALLLSYRDRLAFLDSTIAEIGAFLDENPAHTGSRTLLLAAYTEKTRILRELVELEESRPS